MKCRELADLLVDFVAEDVPEDLREKIREHLCECPPCVRFLETYQVTIKVTRRLPPMPLPPELLERLRRAVDEAGCEGGQEPAT